MTLDMTAMRRIFELTDELGIDRERVRVPLAAKGEGSVDRMPNGELRIVIPATIPLETWLATLKARLVELTDN